MRGNVEALNNPRISVPNPFNDMARISFSLPRREAVILELIDICGRNITTILEDYCLAGRHSFSFQAGNYPSGVYLLKMDAGKYNAVRKLILIR